MQPLETEETETGESQSQTSGTSRLAVVGRALRRLGEVIGSAIAHQPAMSRRAVVIAAIAIFFLALTVRLFHWQDAYAVTSQGWQTISDIERGYKREATRMLNEGGLLYPTREVDPGDARLILHPPGYSILIAAVYAVSKESDSMIRLVQIILDSLSAVMVFFIAAQLLNWKIAIIGASLVSLSPHLAFHALWFSPDTLPVLPILISVYLIIRATKRPRILTVVAAGAMLGLSLWLRANALMLAPFLALAIMLLIEKGKRVAYAAAFITATVLVVTPITIRNWVLYRHFIPISIAGGENLVVGIADYDREGRFGMPTSDRDAALKDAEWYNRPDYAGNPWAPDGVERDQARYKRGLEVIRANPIWFLGVMADRACFMLRYNGHADNQYPFNTSTVPVVAAELPLSHSPDIVRSLQSAWSVSAADLLAEDSLVSKQAEAFVKEEGRSLRITGEASGYGDQFASAKIAVKPNTDYVLVMEAIPQGAIAAKVTSADRRIALASEIIGTDAEAKPNKRKGDGEAEDVVGEARMRTIRMAFASGGRSEVRLVISNNGPSPSRPVTEISRVELFELGATSYEWTRYPRALVRGVQKNLFRTNILLPFVIAGVLLLGLGGRGRALIALLAVPVYYLSVQSILCTEYRYILTIHYFLFIMAAVSLYLASRLIASGARWAKKRRGDTLTRRRGETTTK